MTTSLTDPFTAGEFGYNYTAAAAGGALGTLVQQVSLPINDQIFNEYDGMARLLSTRITGAAGTPNMHQYAYDPGNQRTQQVFTAGNYIDYTYDNIGQLKAAFGKESGGAADRLNEQLGYAYDKAGNLSFRTNDLLIQGFGVNGLNELTNSWRSGTLTVQGVTTPAATDVIVSGTGLSSGAATLYGDSTWAREGATPVDGNNTYTATAHDTYGRTDTATVNAYLPRTNNYAYDLNGNLLSDGRRYFEDDDENQLSSVTVSNAWRSEFVYDGKMRRRIRREYSWNVTLGAWNLAQEVRYIYDGNLVIQERDANNLPAVTYTRGRDLSGSLEGAGGIGGMLARSDNHLWAIGDSSAHAYYHCDGNGNITCLINANEVIVAKYLYDPYGNILSQSGALADANLYRFSSKEFHSNSALVYYLYRFYEPSLQRWLNRDPVMEPGFAVLRGQYRLEVRYGVNPYQFVVNDPTDSFDPKGLKVYVCSRKTDLGVFNHVYFWDDDPARPKPDCGEQKSCRSGGRTSNPNDKGPGTDTCAPVPGTGEAGSPDNALGKAIMECCDKSINNGIYAPPIHDCHSALDRCLAKAGADPFRHPRCGPPSMEPIFSPFPLSGQQVGP